VAACNVRGGQHVAPYFAAGLFNFCLFSPVVNARQRAAQKSGRTDLTVESIAVALKGVEQSNTPATDDRGLITFSALLQT
jgi:hypothetical protein